MATINATLAARGLMLKTGTVVDATLIAAPSSTKNASGERDPEMHQTRKGNQWYFGMKAHIGVDAESGLVHTVLGTAANVNDVTQGHGLLHGTEVIVFADAGYQGPDKRTEATGVPWHVALRPGKRRALDKKTPLGAPGGQDREAQGERPGESRASVPGDQAPVRTHQGALSRAREEHTTTHHAVRAEQPLDGAPSTVEGTRGMSAPAAREKTSTGRPTDGETDPLRTLSSSRSSSAGESGRGRGFAEHS